MNRRDWLKKATMLAAAGIAGDQINLLERLGWTRTLFPSAPIKKWILTREYAMGFQITKELLEDDWYYESTRRIMVNGLAYADLDHKHGPAHKAWLDLK